MEYLFKASIVIAIFYVCYKLFLQRETFFKSNRWFLLIGLAVAIFIPFLVIPIYVEYTPIAQNFVVISDGISTKATLQDSFDWMQTVYIIYGLGLLFILVKLGIEFYSLGSMFKRHKIYKRGGYTFIETNHDVPPFSFFKYIVINKRQFNEIELEHIINHEKVHARQLHSVDILLIHLACTIFWFNPLIWLYKKEVQQNLEFIADEEAQFISQCEKSYQTLLLKASLPNYQMVLANNFYNSLIKNRIVMLHKSKSNKLNMWKYALVLPILAVFLMSANTKKIYVEKSVPVEDAVTLADPSVENALGTNFEVSDEKEPASALPSKIKTNDPNKKRSNTNQSKNTSNSNSINNTKLKQEMVVITKDFTDAQLDNLKSELKGKGISVKFKGVKRNDDNEITAIKIEVSSKTSNANYHTENDDAILPIKIGFDSEGGNLSIGNSGPRHSADSVYTIESDNGDYKIHTAGKADNVFVISGDDDKKFFIKSAGKVRVGSKAKTVFMSKDGKATAIGADHVVIKGHPKGKAVWISGDDEDKFYEIDDNGVFAGSVGDSIHVKRMNKGSAVWVGKESDHKVYELNNDGKNKFFISTDSDETPLFILDGKEISKKEMDELDSDSIEKVEVLKGDSATEKYGDKGKNGVVIITLKDKE